MTLYRQLVVFTLALFLVLFTGTWFAKLENTRSFLDGPARVARPGHG